MKTLHAPLLAALLFCLAPHGATHAKADPAKVLRIAFEAADDGFDLMRTNSRYSNWVAEGIFESLLQYDYLARPVKLAPRTAKAMPEISDGGKTWLFHIQKGIHFAPDPAFKGVRRELVAQDYVYSIKRLMDPANRSNQSGNFDGKIVGMDEAIAAAKKTGKFDYEAPLAGLEALDSHTLRIRLTNPDHTFGYLMALPMAGAVAREVAELYGQDTGAHPVGTGPYMLKQYVPRSKIVLEANPEYRGFVWDFKAREPWDEQLVRDMQGKHMPQVGRIEISIIEEDQSRALAFSSGQLDIEQMAEFTSSRMLDGDRLKPEFAAKGIGLYRFPEAGRIYTYFNMKDPTVGGYGKEKIALRRAIAMAFDIDAVITQVYFGQAIRANSSTPPGIAGHDPSYRSSIPHDPALANKLLDHFGYKKGSDGFRTLPDGKPLTIKIHSVAKAREKVKMEIWKKSLAAIGLRGDFPVAGFADNLKAAYQCQLPMWGLGGVAAIPDANDFFISYYGPNSLQGNFGCYQSASFDQAYRKAMLLPDGPERNALYHHMERQMEADTAMVPEVVRIRSWLIQPWVKGFKKHPTWDGTWQYLDVEKR